MNSQLDTKTPGKYFFIPILYFAIIIALLYLQFGKSIPFSDTFKELSITGKKSAGSNNRGLSEVKLEYGEFSLVISPSKQVNITGENGQISLSLTGYAKYPDRLEIRFSHGFMLVFVQEPDTNRTLLLYEYDQEIPETIHIPFELRNTQEISRIEGFPVLQHKSQSSGDGYFVRLTAGSTIDVSQGMLAIKPESERKLITIESGGASSIISYWFSVQPVSITQSVFEAEINAFLDKCYSGWKVERYDRFSGSWKGNTAKTFSESLINAFGAEAFRRGEGYTFITRIVPMQTDHDLGYVSNPFTGNIVNTSSELLNDAERAAEIARSGKIKTTEEVMLLLRFKDILNSQYLSLIQSSLDSILKDRDDSSASLQAGAVYLSLSLFDSLSAAGLQCLEEVLLPRITPYQGGYIFESRQGVSDTYLGILTGLSLANFSQNPLYRQIGQSAVATYIGMADSAGRLPRELIKDDSDWSRSPEALFPEEIYTLLTDNPYYPRITSLNNGIWSWSCSREIETVSRGNQIVITTAFPIDGIYHISVGGVRPFTSLTLYGIPWKSDPQFQRYSSGWAYNPDSNMLFLKIKQRRAVETIILDYTPAQPEAEAVKPIFIN